MALGRAIVASRVGGIPSVLEPGASGMLVPPNNPRALAAAISDLIDEPGLAFGLAARALTAGRKRTVEREAALVLEHVLGPTGASVR
jgi:starch synthase